MTEENVEEEVTSALELPGAEPELLEVKDILLEDIAELANVRGAYHGIEGLAETMHLDGQLQPCWVRPAQPGAEHGRPYELIFGYRRKRAAELLNEREIEGWDSIRCEVRNVPDGEELTKVIVENWQRESPSPVSEAKAMLALKESRDPPMTNVEIARYLGCDPSQVSHRLSLLSLAIPEEPAPAELETSEAKTESDASPEAPESDTPAAETDSEEKEKKPGKEKKPVDILQMVHDGEISPSVAEVITGLDDRQEQEQLATLSKKHDWSVKKATAWAKKVKEHNLDEGSDAEMGPIEMVTVADVVELPSLNVKEGISELEFKQINLYALLRNAMDREIMDYLDVELGVPYSSYWVYINGLNEEQIDTLTKRMLVRYVGAAHRYSDLEPELKDQLGAPEDEPTNLLKDDLVLPTAQASADRALPEASNLEDIDDSELDDEMLSYFDEESEE